MAQARKNKVMSSEFIERIMLAVTEVNGCAVCSYAHTKIALEQGMSEEEIGKLLSGDTKDIPAEEAPAIFFAQHYADTRGNPSRDSWQRMVKTYGAEKANGILGSIQVIMIGNIYGIAMSAFQSRLKGKPIGKSSLSYEAGMLMSVFVLFPFTLIGSLMSSLAKKPLLYFGDAEI